MNNAQTYSEYTWFLDCYGSFEEYAAYHAGAEEERRQDMAIELLASERFGPV